MSAEKLFWSLVSGSRASLSRAITLVESKRSTETRSQLIRLVYEYHRKSRPKSLRIGVSGGPGCGKSTFIECFGSKLVEKYNKKIAVLAVDPSSAITGGSLLADKTRMHNLTSSPHAFIRPSPSSGHYGGVTRSTGDAIVLCESAGYDVILIETVGVGQSEYEVSHLCDLMALLIAPSGGDEIQAIKKGIVEMANIIVVTKSDGDLVKHARKMSADILSATKFMNIGVKPIVKRCSSVTSDGIDDVWLAIQDLASDNNKLLDKRRQQRVTLLKMYLIDELLARLDNEIDLKEFEQQVKNDDVLIYDVIHQIILRFASRLK